MTPKEIGKTLKNLRRSKGYSIRRMAELASCSPSFISQIELGNTSPSLSSMARICSGLNLTMRDFLDAHEKQRGVVNLPDTAQGDVVTTWPTSRLRYVLPSSVQANQSYLLLELDPLGETALRAANRTMKELAVVLLGTLEFELGASLHTLKTTQAVYFDLITPHRWRNLSDSPAKVLLINPSFTVVKNVGNEVSPASIERIQHVKSRFPNGGT